MTTEGDIPKIIGQGMWRRKGSSPDKPPQDRENAFKYFKDSSSSSGLKREDLGGENPYGVQSLYLGIAIKEVKGTLKLAFTSHDGIYSNELDSDPFKTEALNDGDLAALLADHITKVIRDHRDNNLYKFLGAGLTERLVELSPELSARLWLELDVIPFVFSIEAQPQSMIGNKSKDRRSVMTLDEEADSMARKCLARFGPNVQPRLTLSPAKEVLVDSEGFIRLAGLDDYQHSVRRGTWEATMKYAESLKEKRIRIALFNSTPQGGGVALMRHALMRFLNLVGVDAHWYVPRPNPKVFRITKDNHNIVQGVAPPEKRLTQQQIRILDDWCRQNVDRSWIKRDEGEIGPLAPSSEGGAHIIIVDDPQMPSLVKIAKEIEPIRPVIFRSHIQIWDNVKEADLFISHPVREFVPHNVPVSRVGYMPATTDWLDGLNKRLNNWDKDFYLHEFGAECHKIDMRTVDYCNRRYIVQIARFDPAKGIPDVLAAYAELRREYMKDMPTKDVPQLVIAGHGAIDDPDAKEIYAQTILEIENKYQDLKGDIVVMRLGPSDQMLNALLSCAYVVLQLSTREGFEVKVSEALHKGVPIITTKAGGIPLQVRHGKSGFLVESGDYKAVANHLYHLFTDRKTYEDMSSYANAYVSDEVSTVGNALCWLYLADMLTTKGAKVEPNSAWVNDMAREHAGVPYEDGETRLPRQKNLDLNTDDTQ